MSIVKEQYLRVVPHDIEVLFDELKYYTGPDTIEDADAGLRWQYKMGVLEKEELENILVKAKRLRSLYERGLWKP